jgi:hypothetical protein
MVIDSDLPLWMPFEHKLNTKETNDLRSLVGSRYLHDTVRVNLKSDLDLWNTSGCWWDAGQLKLAEKVVVLSQRAFTLVDLDQDGGLVISSRGETDR